MPVVQGVLVWLTSYLVALGATEAVPLVRTGGKVTGTVL